MGKSVNQNKKRKEKAMAKRIVDKVSQVISAWATLAPTKTFGGYTLEQFKAKSQPSFALRDELSALDNHSLDRLARRDDADVETNDAALLVVNGIKGDPEHGEDGPLYAAMGYVRKSDRRSGLARKASDTTTPPMTTPAKN
jgi:hypothetical protein